MEIESRQKLNIGVVILSLLAGLLTWIAVAMITSSISLLLATLIALFLKNTGISDSLLFGILDRTVGGILSEWPLTLPVYIAHLVSGVVISAITKKQVRELRISRKALGIFLVVICLAFLLTGIFITNSPYNLFYAAGIISGIVYIAKNRK